MARMCKRGPKLTVVCHIPNHDVKPSKYFRQKFRMSNDICVLTAVYGKVKCREGLRVSIRASVVASKVLNVQHVKENRRTLTLAKYT